MTPKEKAKELVDKFLVYTDVLDATNYKEEAIKKANGLLNN